MRKNTYRISFIHRVEEIVIVEAETHTEAKILAVAVPEKERAAVSDNRFVESRWVSYANERLK